MISTIIPIVIHKNQNILIVLVFNRNIKCFATKDENH